MIRKLFKEILIEKTSNVKIQFFRFLFVGAAATIVDMLTLFLLREFTALKTLNLTFYFIDVGLFICIMLGFTVGLIVNYILSTLWVFDKSKIKTKKIEFLIFALIGIVGLIINTVIVQLFDTYVNFSLSYIVGKLLATGVAFIWNFTARKLIIYR